MPNFSGIWSVTQQMQAKGASTWPATPGAPTIGTATAGSALCASVTFTAPACAGYPASITGYRVVSTPGCFTATGASSPLTVTGLTDATSYTFKAQATNATGYGPLSCASNSITASNAGSQAYTTAGTYTWVAPAGVTSVSVVAVGAGAGGAGNSGGLGLAGGGGGGLAYANNISVTPGNSYAVKVAASSACSSRWSSFNCNTVRATSGGQTNYRFGRAGGTATFGTGFTGGSGGTSSCAYGGGGAGAAGYSGNGGNGGNGACFCVPFNSGTSGSGGGAGGGATYFSGGGVGIGGQGASGAGGTAIGPCGSATTQRGKGGSGGSDATNSGGAYGGGGYGNGGAGSDGAVNIYWPGNTRSFPSSL